jgi:septal ring factor EnvC (AmiA/AmiB activator)
MIDATNSPNGTTTIASQSNWFHFLLSGAILLGSMAWYETRQAAALRREVAQLRRDNSALRTSLSNSDHEQQQALAAIQKELEQVHAELASERAETYESLTNAEAAAIGHADALVSKLEKQRRQQEAQQRQLTAELSKVEQSTAETSTRLSGISRDVGSVKSEVESVRSVAGQANTSLQQTRGDMGMMSGLIATNADEIQTLRDLGDRNVYEFTLEKLNVMQRVGDIQVALDKTDAKRNRFTVEILAADQRVEKRDKNLNEPVQFYVPGKGGQPYELVVNEVGKNSVKGYLAAPKVTIVRNDSGHAN